MKADPKLEIRRVCETMGSAREKGGGPTEEATVTPVEQQTPRRQDSFVGMKVEIPFK